MTAPVVLEAPTTLTVRERLLGTVAVTSARMLLLCTRSRPARLRPILELLRRGARPAEVAQARRARAVVTTVSLRCASPHGCLLRSVSIVLACRLAGRTVRWRVGMVSPPPALHAWVEAGATPVGEPFDPRQLYTPIITT